MPLPGKGSPSGKKVTVNAPSAGRISMLVQQGDTVRESQDLFEVRSVPVKSEVAGKVVSVSTEAETGGIARKDDPILTIEVAS